MKLHWLYGALFSGRRFAWASAGAMLLSSMAVSAATEVRVWHSLSPYNKDVFEKLVKVFNRDQKDVTVKLKAFGSEEEIEAALAAAKKRDDRPQLVQLDDDRAPDEVAGRSYIQPLHALLAKHPIKDAKRSEEHTSELQSLMRISD